VKWGAASTAQPKKIGGIIHSAYTYVEHCHNRHRLDLSTASSSKHAILVSSLLNDHCLLVLMSSLGQSPKSSSTTGSREGYVQPSSYLRPRVPSQGAVGSEPSLVSSQPQAQQQQYQMSPVDREQLEALVCPARAVHDLLELHLFSSRPTSNWVVLSICRASYVRFSRLARATMFYPSASDSSSLTLRYWLRRA